LDVRKW